MKNLLFFRWLLFQNKKCWYFEFLMNQIFGQRFIIFDKLRYRGQLCWSYGPSKLLLHFIEYDLDQLNKKHTKMAVNSTMEYFESSSQKECLLKVWIFGLLDTKWWPCKIFGKLNINHLLMANILKLHEYQTFGLIKMHNMTKIDLLITNSIR